MDLGIAGKTALVTASSQGMGRNIALALAAEGANIILYARSADKLQAVKADIEARHGVKVLAVAGDMANAADCARLADTLRSACNGPDIYVMNTGRAPNPIKDVLEERDSARWEQAHTTQLMGCIETTRAVVPTMLGKGWGRIVAVTSASVMQPMPHHSLSTVYRAGVHAYMKHLAREVGPAGITVNCVAPALIESLHRGPPPAGRSEAENIVRRKMTLLGRLGTQEEVTSVVAFFASQQAGFVTGASVQVDGGMVAGLF